MIDPDHSLNSIDYYIEPSEVVIDKLAWINIVEGRILCTKVKGQEYYNIPSGKRAFGETDAQALHQVMGEILGIFIEIPSMRFVGIFEAQVEDFKPGILARMTCYSATYRGDLTPASEVIEVVWLNHSNRNMVSPVDTLIFDFLHEKGMLN